ncbi:hypothetical protein ABT351_31575, partial [Micromonospora sp. NPDC000018]
MPSRIAAGAFPPNDRLRPDTMRLGRQPQDRGGGDGRGNVVARDGTGEQDRGSGFVTATVVDPFGNLLGVMYNPHYVET